MTKPGVNIQALTLIAGAVFCILLLSEPTFAQCAMCRASLGANSSFLRNFNIGVLVLLVPPVSIFCAIFVVAYRHRK
jgi:hypothetical protein